MTKNRRHTYSQSHPLNKQKGFRISFYRL